MGRAVTVFLNRLGFDTKTPTNSEMAVIRATFITILNQIIHRPSPTSSISTLRALTPAIPHVCAAIRLPRRRISFTAVRCAASNSGDANKVSSRFTHVQQLMQEAENRARSADTGPIPQITLDHVTVSFARSGGAGGQNVNKVNTKVDMRFNVMNACWLSDHIKKRIIQMEKNRVNKEGELVISSTRSRTQKDNIEDALGKLQAIIDAAAYVPPPPSEEQKKKILKMAALSEEKRLLAKKALSQKKASRRTRWD